MKKLVVFTMVWGATGCYAHHGAPVQATSQEWTAMADNACARRDLVAAKTLLSHAADAATADERAAIEARMSAPCGEDHR